MVHRLDGAVELRVVHPGAGQVIRIVMARRFLPQAQSPLQRAQGHLVEAHVSSCAFLRNSRSSRGGTRLIVY